MNKPVSKEDALVIRLFNGHVESVTWRDPQGEELSALCKIKVVCDCVECQVIDLYDEPNHKIYITPRRKVRR